MGQAAANDLNVMKRKPVRRLCISSKTAFTLICGKGEQNSWQIDQWVKLGTFCQTQGCGPPFIQMRRKIRMVAVIICQLL